ncbi:hypothetical protein [Antrihabitans cavernicola]|uniref:HEAT repeat domain-containing protein n=1 Tax=Antrihabitans cavernicola TaxID=2495913 RepID=A0A5A7S7N2_9NOCA|nr:hypothetical protein [Spelaeibacter cavernicola]KAA0018991.1 hypothetical protein FOY51_23455 [Spelaeibacter cavernicola]
MSVDYNPWQEFRLATFGDPYLVWHDGADYTKLRRKWLLSRGSTADLLRLGLGAGDPLAAQSIAALAGQFRPPRDLLPALLDQLPAATGSFRVRVAQACFALTGEQRYGREILPVLREPGHWGPRIDAAIALREFAPTAELIDALAAAVCDVEYLVRYHSSSTLLTMSGLVGEVDKYPDLFARITSDSTPDMNRSAAAQLRGTALAEQRKKLA